MALSKNITTTFTLENSVDKSKIDFTKYFIRALEVKSPNYGILNLIPKALPINPAYVNSNKTITLNRVVRDTDAAIDLEFENQDGTKRTFMPAATFSQIESKMSYNPGARASVKIVDKFDSTNVEWFTELATKYRDFSVSHSLATIEKLYTLIDSDLTSYKLYNHSTSIKDADRGGQLVQAADKKTSADAIELIEDGTRKVIATDCFNKDKGLDLLEASINYFLHLGTPKSAEPVYPFAYTGYDKEDLLIVMSRKFRMSLDSSKFQRLISGTKRGNVEFGASGYDGIEFYEDKLLPDGVECIVMVKDYAFYLEPNSPLQVAGIYRQGGLVKLGNDKVEHLLPHQGSVEFVKNYYLGILKTGLAFQISSK